MGGGAWEEAVGERHRARAPVACAGDFEWLQVAGAKSTCPGVGVGTPGPDVRQEPDGGARALNSLLVPGNPEPRVQVRVQVGSAVLEAALVTGEGRGPPRAEKGAGAGPRGWRGDLREGWWQIRGNRGGGPMAPGCQAWAPSCQRQERQVGWGRVVNWGLKGL